MPKFGVRVPHTLSHEEARSRLERFAELLQEKFASQVSDLQQSWEGDTLRFRFKTYGIPLDGGITVAEKELALAGDLPFSAMMFRGKIETAIREQLERLVATEHRLPQRVTRWRLGATGSASALQAKALRPTAYSISPAF